MTKKTKLTGTWIAAAALLAFCLVAVAPAAADEVTHTCADATNCIVCQVAGMINALPEASTITLDNAAHVTNQIHAIDRIKGELTEAQYDELLTLVEHGKDSTGYGMDVPTKYVEAVEKIREFGENTLVVSKKFSAGDATVDVYDAEVRVKITPVTVAEGYSFTELTVTMSTMDYLLGSFAATSSDFYSSNTAGWTYAYPLPAGTYNIEEVDYSGAKVNGEDFVTTSTTYTVNGEEIAEGEVFEVSADTIVTLDNVAPAPVTTTTVTFYNGDSSVGTLQISNNAESISLTNINPENDGYTLLGWGLEESEGVLIKADGTFNADANSDYINYGYWNAQTTEPTLSLYAKWVKNKIDVGRDTATGSGEGIELTLNTDEVTENFLLTIPPSIAMSYDKESGNYIAEATISLSNIVVNATAPKDLSVNVESTNSFVLKAEGVTEQYAYTIATKSSNNEERDSTNSEHVVNGNTLTKILLFDYSERENYATGVITSDMTFTHFANFIQLAKLDAKDTLTFKVSETLTGD